MKIISDIAAVLLMFFSTATNAQQNYAVPPKKVNPMISSEFNYSKKHAAVLGKGMAYVETGKGDPIVFLHGNPTSSYIWRNVIPYLEKQGRCIAPDLMGMGDSQKLEGDDPQRYSFLEQSKYLDALLDQLGANTKITFVAHDWGSALAFYWAYRHPDAVKGIVYMEAIVTPLSWDDMPELGRNIFKALRSPAGEKMVLEQNSFIEINLPNTVQRALTKEEMDEYRRPFLHPGEDRRVMLSWARQLPFEGDSSDEVSIIKKYSRWLSQSRVPKLFIESEPGTMQPNARALCNTWPAQTKIIVKGIHYVQEDSPDAIGTAIATWYQGQLSAQNKIDKNNLKKKEKMSTSTLERNKASIRHLYQDLLNSRKFDELNTIISENYTGIRGEKGVKGFKESVVSVVEGFPDIKWTIEDLLADGDKVTVRWTWQGTNTQPFRGIPASNKPVTDNAIVIYQFDDEGKIIHAWLQGDRLGVLIQIGAIPANLVPAPPMPKN